MVIRSLVPLSALRLHYTNLQLRSSSPTLLGAYATTATEIYLSLSIICQITSSLKFIIAVYEDKDGVSYTDGSRQSHSGLGYKSKSGLSTDLSSPPQSHSQSHNARAYTTRRASRPMDIDSEGLDDLEALAGASGSGSGSQGGALKIFRTMQFKVQDEAIELDDRGKEVDKTEAGMRGLE
jgi:hypothetical protein